MTKRVMLIYPPGELYQRGENRSQGNIENSTATTIRACNDLGYCAAILERKGFGVFIRDYQTETKKIKEFEYDLISYKPDLIMMSVTNGTIINDLELIPTIKKISNAIIVLKGAMFYNINYEHIKLLNMDNVDYLIGGEEEYAIEGIVDYTFNQIGAISDIKNIVYKGCNNEWTINKFDAWIENLDMLPFPARHLMNNALYIRPDNNETMATIQVSRGCSASCIYCLSPCLSGGKIRWRSPINVLEELKECYFKYSIKNFFFRADTFTMSAQWVEELCLLLLNSVLNGKIKFTVNSRVKPLKKETLETLKIAGCFAIAIGFESGSDETLELIKKGTTVNDNIVVSQWVKELNILLYGFYLIGFPWEDESHLEKTKKHIFEIDADYIEIHIAIPYLGTELYSLCLDACTLKDNSYGFDYFNSNTTGTRYLSMQVLINYRKKTIREFYLRPSYILNRLIECINQPKRLWNYFLYALRMIQLTRIK